jgi:hypothetical protein
MQGRKRQMRAVMKYIHLRSWEGRLTFAIDWFQLLETPPLRGST